MARPPLPVGTSGKIEFFKVGRRQVRARARFRDYDGVTRSVTRHGPTQPAAERRLKEALRDRKGPVGGHITMDARLHDVATTWLAEIETSDLSAGSKELYERTLKNRVVPALGGLLMREMDVPSTDKFIKAVRKEHGPGAARTARNVLSLVLGMAVRHGALVTNPVQGAAKISKGKRTRPRALTIEETTDLLKKIRVDEDTRKDDEDVKDLDVADLVEFMLGTGVRIGEALGVRASVVDTEAGVLEVNAIAVRLKGQGTVLQDRPKTEAGWRVIALPEHVVELCRSRMAMSWPKHEHGLLFPGVLGGVRNPSNANRDLRDVLDRVDAGYAWVTTHTFRKTVATRLDDAGLSARAIADHLGHAKPSMTQDVYMGRSVAAAEAATALARRRS